MVFIHLMAKNQGKLEDVAGNYCQRRGHCHLLQCEDVVDQSTFVYQTQNHHQVHKFVQNRLQHAQKDKNVF